MKRLILSLTMLSSLLMADGFYTGLEVSTSQSKSVVSGLENKVPYSNETIGNAQRIKLNVGYQEYIFRGGLSIYAEDQSTYSTAYGSHMTMDIFIFDNIFIGTSLGIGNKIIAGNDEKYFEYGVNTGIVIPMTKSTNLEVGVTYYQQSFNHEDTQSSNLLDPMSPIEITDSINVKDKFIGVFLRYTFNY